MVVKKTVIKKTDAGFVAVKDGGEAVSFRPVLKNPGVNVGIDKSGEVASVSYPGDYSLEDVVEGQKEIERKKCSGGTCDVCEAERISRWKAERSRKREMDPRPFVRGFSKSRRKVL